MISLPRLPQSKTNITKNASARGASDADVTLQPEKNTRCIMPTSGLPAAIWSLYPSLSARPMTYAWVSSLKLLSRRAVSAYP